MSHEVPFPFRVICGHQEWSGSDVPFCECLLFRIPIKNGYSIRDCAIEHCPKKSDTVSALEVLVNNL
jgi:hypothetical protein